MDWNSTFPPESSLNFLYNYNFDQYPEAGNGLVVQAMMNNNNKINEDTKKKLTREQLDTLERSFQEEIKLDPDRKMRLSMELGIQQKQVAVWFQNRRARWKAKQLEQSYTTLKQNYDVVCRENKKLQDQVMNLKGMLMERETKNHQVSTLYTDISGEEAMESTSIRRSSEPMIAENHYHPMAACDYILNVDEYYPVSTPDGGAQLPSYPH